MAIFTYSGLPLNTSAVKEVQLKANSIIYGISKNDQELPDSIIKRIKDLEQLRDSVSSVEEAFFNMLHIDGKNSKEKLEKLQQKIDQINKSNNILSIISMENIYKNFIGNIDISSYLSEISNKGVTQLIEQDSFIQSFVKENLKQENIDPTIIIKNVIEGLSNNITYINTTNRKKGYFLNRAESESSKAVGLQRYLQVKGNFDKKEGLKITTKTDLPVSLRNKIVEAIYAVHNKTQKN